jgi:hypothetical protein
MRDLDDGDGLGSPMPDFGSHSLPRGKPNQQQQQKASASVSLASQVGTVRPVRSAGSDPAISKVNTERLAIIDSVECRVLHISDDSDDDDGGGDDGACVLREAAWAGSPPVDGACPCQEPPREGGESTTMPRSI